jgi:hypothetical protein
MQKPIFRAAGKIEKTERGIKTPLGLILVINAI